MPRHAAIQRADDHSSQKVTVDGGGNADVADENVAASTGDVAVLTTIDDAIVGCSDQASVTLAQPLRTEPTSRLPKLLARVLLPALALVLALAAGYLKWLDGSARESTVAQGDSVEAATESTIAMLSYGPDTVEKDLGAARDHLTGDFRDSYTGLINDVVIPGAREKKIAAVATVPAAASISASKDHAVVLVFINQNTTIGNDPPTSTASSVRVTLEKVGDRWLVSEFIPV